MHGGASSPRGPLERETETWQRCIFTCWKSPPCCFMYTTHKNQHTRWPDRHPIAHKGEAYTKHHKKQSEAQRQLERQRVVVSESILHEKRRKKKAETLVAFQNAFLIKWKESSRVESSRRRHRKEVISCKHNRVLFWWSQQKKEEVEEWSGEEGRAD